MPQKLCWLLSLSVAFSDNLAEGKITLQPCWTMGNTVTVMCRKETKKAPRSSSVRKASWLVKQSKCRDVAQLPNSKGGKKRSCGGFGGGLYYRTRA